MCGIKSKLFLCGLVLLLLLCSPLYSAEVYSITDAELTELEDILTMQATTINQLQDTLTTQSSTLTMLNSSLQTATDTLQMQDNTIKALKISLTEYERGVRVKLWTTSAISIGIGFSAGVVIYSLLQ